MTTVEKVKAVCKKKKIPIYKLERDLGFSNGYIGQLKKGTMPAERLKLVSDYLHVDMKEFLGEAKKLAALSDEQTAKIQKINQLFLQLSDQQQKDFLLQLEAVARNQSTQDN